MRNLTPQPPSLRGKGEPENLFASFDWRGGMIGCLGCWGSNCGLITRLGFKPQADSESPLKRTQENRNSVGLNRLSLLATELIPWRAGNHSDYIRFMRLARIAHLARLGFKPQADSESPLKRTQENRYSSMVNK